jgi:hypothetical protein
MEADLLVNPEVFAENRFLENIQVMVLLVATIVFLVRSFALYKKDGFVLLPYGLFVSTFPFIGAGRELSFGAALGISAQSVLGIKILMGCIVVLLVAAALFVFLRFVAPKTAAIFRYLSHPTSLHIYLAILVFGASSAFEQGSFQMPKSVILEEILELIAFAILLRAAWILK